MLASLYLSCHDKKEIQITALKQRNQVGMKCKIVSEMLLENSKLDGKKGYVNS